MTNLPNSHSENYYLPYALKKSRVSSVPYALPSFSKSKPYGAETLVGLNFNAKSLRIQRSRERPVLALFIYHSRQQLEKS
jgi:hypothetical protein